MSASYEAGYREGWKEAREEMAEELEEVRRYAQGRERARILVHITKALRQWQEVMSSFQDEVQWRLLLSVLAEIEFGEHLPAEKTNSSKKLSSSDD